MICFVSSYGRNLAVDAPNRSVQCDLWAYIWGSSVVMAEILLAIDLHGNEGIYYPDHINTLLKTCVDEPNSILPLPFLG